MTQVDHWYAGYWSDGAVSSAVAALAAESNAVARELRGRRDSALCGYDPYRAAELEAQLALLSPAHTVAAALFRGDQPWIHSAIAAGQYADAALERVRACGIMVGYGPR